MSETVVYMRGNFPFPHERLVTAELVEDAKQVLAVDGDALRALSSELEGHPGFLDTTAIKEVVSHYVPDGAQADAVSRLIFGADSRLRALGVDVPGLLSA